MLSVLIFYCRFLKMNLESKNIGLSPQEAMEEFKPMYNVYFSDKKKKGKSYKDCCIKQATRKKY